MTLVRVWAKKYLLLIRLGMLVSDLTKDFLLISLFEGPALGQECIVEDVSILGLEAHSFDNLAQHGASEVAEVQDFSSVRIHCFLDRRWVEESCADQVLSQLDLLLDKLR